MQVDPFTFGNMKTLMDEPSGPAVSLFMPAHPNADYPDEDRIRFKNLLAEAKNLLEAKGENAESLLAPGWSLYDDIQFWRHQANGLALFLSQDFMRSYRLPMEVPEFVSVNSRFNIKPLIPLCNRDARYYILALSQGDVRLLQCLRARVEEQNPDIPSNLEEAMAHDDPEKSVQFHTRAHGQGGGREAMFHGQGALADNEKRRIESYFQQVDAGVSRMLANDTAPLILAGQKHLLPLYRKINSYPHLLKEAVTVNPEQMDSDELRKEALRLVEPYFERETQAALDNFHRLHGTGLTAKGLEETLKAAHHGRVETLFITLSNHVWGIFREDGEVEVHEEQRPDNEDLVNLAAIKTLGAGGSVYGLKQSETPTSEHLAAILRY
ncbi:MAG: hypothetical protein ACOCVM_04890 [Desulfovibrionaceae bacterium]